MFDSLDVAFYEDFVRFLTYDTTYTRRKEISKWPKINTVGKEVRDRNFCGTAR